MTVRNDGLRLTQIFTQSARVAGAVLTGAATVAATLYVLGKETTLLDGTALDIFNHGDARIRHEEPVNSPVTPAPPVIEIPAEAPEAPPQEAPPQEESAQEENTPEATPPEQTSPEDVQAEDVQAEDAQAETPSTAINPETPAPAERPVFTLPDGSAIPVPERRPQNGPEAGQDAAAPDQPERVLLPDLPPSALPYATPGDAINDARQAIDELLYGPSAPALEDEDDEDTAVLQEEGELVDVVLPPPRPEDEQSWEAGLSREELIRVRVIEAFLQREGKNTPSWQVHDAIAYAHRYTGVDMMYMYRLAYAESTFRPHAHNSAGGGRGACGLYQFRASSTYLETIYNHRHNLPAEYRDIGSSVERFINSKGQPRYRVKAGADAQAVFNACYDPRFSSVLAGFFTLDLHDAIRAKSNLRRAVTHADLYISHFLGINGGPRVIRVHGNSGNHNLSITRYVSAGQRSANRGIFNRVSTVGGFYNFFVNNKGMTDTAFQRSTGLYAQLQLPDAPPLPERRPDFEAAELAQAQLTANTPLPQINGPR